MILTPNLRHIAPLEAGWNDASSGPLLPSLQARYEIRYLVSESMTGIFSR
jgi:hypothetical protein